MKSFAVKNGALTIRLGTEADRQTIYARLPLIRESHTSFATACLLPVNALQPA